MSHTSEATGRLGVVGTLRAKRDSLMEDLAKVTLAVTSTHVFQRLNALVAAPTLLASAILRQKRVAVMNDLLGQLNMPSRTDVLTLSQRLTRIEMVLDDVGAGLDQVRRASAERPAPRDVIIREPRPSEPHLREVRPGAAPTIKEA